MKLIKDYKMALILLVIIFVLFFLKKEIAVNSINLSLKSALSMIGILPPILLIVNLLDAWVPREAIVRHMGDDAGMKGYFWAFILGTFAAGPLYAAFPVAALLAKKGARIAYIVFLLGIWTTTKLPIFMYELNFFGSQFTLIHIMTGILVYFLFSILFEKVLLKNKMTDVYRKLSEA